MATKQYFEFKIETKSEEEREARIADLNKRGFHVARTFEYEKESNSWHDGGYRNRDGAKYRFKGNESRKIYGAIMRRENDEYINERVN